MAYTDIISLSEAKNYLRIDINNTSDDTQITMMINASLRYVEKYTNHILFARSKDFLLIDGCVRVYDFPINSVTSPTDNEQTVKPTYTIFETDTSETTLVLNVGYSSVSDIPSELIEFAYYMISLYYNEGKEGQDTADVKIPEWAKSSIDHYRRFII